MYTTILFLVKLLYHALALIPGMHFSKEKMYCVTKLNTNKTFVTTDLQQHNTKFNVCCDPKLVQLESVHVLHHNSNNGD